jgi:hypothetical protein
MTDTAHYLRTLRHGGRHMALNNSFTRKKGENDGNKATLK